MEISGTIHNGVVVLETNVQLPEGTRVTVTAPDVALAGPTHYELFRGIIGEAEGLPQDMAQNHNHYLRGGPKQ